jgi:hypothetical protein
VRGLDRWERLGLLNDDRMRDRFNTADMAARHREREYPAEECPSEKKIQEKIEPELWCPRELATKAGRK